MDTSMKVRTGGAMACRVDVCCRDVQSTLRFLDGVWWNGSTAGSTRQMSSERISRAIDREAFGARFWPGRLRIQQLMGNGELDTDYLKSRQPNTIVCATLPRGSPVHGRRTRYCRPRPLFTRTHRNCTFISNRHTKGSCRSSATYIRVATSSWPTNEQGDRTRARLHVPRDVLEFLVLLEDFADLERVEFFDQHTTGTRAAG